MELEIKHKRKFEILLGDVIDNNVIEFHTYLVTTIDENDFGLLDLSGMTYYNRYENMEELRKEVNELIDTGEFTHYPQNEYKLSLERKGD